MKLIFCIKSSACNLSIHPSVVNLSLQTLRHHKERQRAFLPQRRQYPYRTMFPAWSLSSWPCFQPRPVVPVQYSYLQLAVRGFEENPTDFHGDRASKHCQHQPERQNQALEVMMRQSMVCPSVCHTTAQVSLSFHESVPALFPAMVCPIIFPLNTLPLLT